MEQHCRRRRREEREIRAHDDSAVLTTLCRNKGTSSRSPSARLPTMAFRTILVIQILATTTAYMLFNIHAPSSTRDVFSSICAPSTITRCHCAIMRTEAEERAAKIYALREKKVDLTREAQQANARAYRERAAFEEKRKKAARSDENDWRTSAAALDKLFNLEADATLASQQIEASEDEALALAAEAEAARYTEEIAQIDEEIAMLSGDTAAAEAARATAEGAAAVRAKADAAGPQVEQARATALEKAADAAADKAVRERQKAAEALAEADAAAACAKAIVERAARMEEEAASKAARQQQPAARRSWRRNWASFVRR